MNGYGYGRTRLGPVPPFVRCGCMRAYAHTFRERMETLRNQRRPACSSGNSGGFGGLDNFGLKYSANEPNEEAAAGGGGAVGFWEVDECVCI